MKSPCIYLTFQSFDRFGLEAAYGTVTGVGNSTAVQHLPGACGCPERSLQGHNVVIRRSFTL